MMTSHLTYLDLKDHLAGRRAPRNTDLTPRSINQSIDRNVNEPRRTIEIRIISMVVFAGFPVRLTGRRSLS